MNKLSNIIYSYALQFHIEVTLEMVKEWFADREDLDLIMKKTLSIYPHYRLKADLFYRAFLLTIIEAVPKNCINI